MSALPAQVDALQKRVAAQEAQLAGKTGVLCPICNAAEFKRTGSRPSPEMGWAGIKLDPYVCAGCGHTEERERDEGAHR